MATTIFFSWQADTSTKVGRNFVERALERAIDHIANDLNLEESARDVSIDRDTKGVPGSPPIVDTIFRKIDQAAVFVPDLTFVGKRIDGRPIPNPNVLIEYGWALKSLSHSRIVPVMNIAFGEPNPESMPFDMRHLRNPILYNCPVDADERVRTAVRNQLASELASAIRIVLESEGAKPGEDLESQEYVPHEAADGRGRFRKPSEPLGFAESYPGRGAEEIYLMKSPAVWLRVLPVAGPKSNWLVSDLKSKATESGSFLHPLGRGWQTFNFLRSEDGFGIYAPLSDHRDATMAVVFAFTTGEVWTIDTYILDALSCERQRIIPSMEDDFRAALKEYGKFLLRLGAVPPFRWIAGMENLKGRKLYDPTGQMAAFRGPAGSCVSDVIIEKGLYSPGESEATALRPFFAKLFDSCGVARPAELDGA